ncbi:MAG: hypothetical protein IKM04_03830 [Clostridia bacterium]|nr:hypothetical protein [Clostridia bacterium]
MKKGPHLLPDLPIDDSTVRDAGLTVDDIVEEFRSRPRPVEPLATPEPPKETDEPIKEVPEPIKKPPKEKKPKAEKPPKVKAVKEKKPPKDKKQGKEPPPEPLEEGVIDLEAFDAAFRRTRIQRRVLKERILADNARELRLARRNDRKISRIRVVKIENAVGGLPIPESAKEELAAEKAKNPVGSRFASPTSNALRKVRIIYRMREDRRLKQANLERRIARLELSVAARMTMAFLFSLPLVIFALADSFELPLPELISFAANPRIHLWVTLGIMAAVMLAGYDVMISGIVNILTLRFNADSLTALSVIPSVGYCVYCLVTGEYQFRPLCAMPALAVAFSLLGDRIRHSTYYRSLRACIKVKSCRTVARMKNKIGRDTVYACGHSQGRERFEDGIFEQGPSETSVAVLAPLLSAAAVFIAVAASSSELGDRPPFLWCWSIIASFIPALGFFICESLPYGLLSRRLRKLGVYIGGGNVLKKLSKPAYVAVTDSDLFPEKTVTLGGLKMLSSDAVHAVSVAASVLSASGSGLAEPFIGAASTLFAPIHTVTELEFLEPGGITGVIENRRVYVGNAEFMRFQGFEIPPNIRLRTAVFIAENDSLLAVAAIRYQVSKANEYALSLLVHHGYVPVFATRDFNITPEFLLSRFGLRKGEYLLQDYGSRVALDTDRRELDCSGVLVVHPRLGYLTASAQLLVGARRYRKAVFAGFVLSLLSAMIGLGLGSLIVMRVWTELATPLNMLIYYVLWLLPPLVFGCWINKY